MAEPRELTRDECRVLLLRQIDAVVRSVLADERIETAEAKIRLAVFSTLVIIDGESVLPGFGLLTRPHPDDEEYHRGEGENWWPAGVDLAGELHGEWSRKYRANT